jgi:hypothetical protein
VRSPIPADASVLAALFFIGLSAALPAAALYWLMRPTILPNPGIGAYRPPKPDPLLSLTSTATRDLYALSIAAAKRENELLQGRAQAAFALAQDTEPAPGRLDQTTRQQKRGARSTRRQDRLIPTHTPTPPFNSWARDNSFAAWYPEKSLPGSWLPELKAGLTR